MRLLRSRRHFVQMIALAGLAALPAWLAGQQATGGRGGNNPFPGGTNDDRSLRPTPPLTRLFTQDAYTEYVLLEPGSEQFRISRAPA